MLAIATAAVVCSACPAAQARPTRPNFLVIQVDDQADNTFTHRIMPRTFSWLVRHGTRFDDGLAAPPQCCPDRAGVLTGQYPHNHGVFSNDPGYNSLRDKRSTLPVWLRRSGYRTALIGKFLNQYTESHGGTPAPGFDHWFAFDGHPGYFDYGVSDDGKHLEFRHARKAYSTHVFTAAAKDYIRKVSRRKRPFFMWLAYNSPHDAERIGGGSGKRRFTCPPLAPTPPGRAEMLHFAHLTLPKDPSFDEADVSDKPPGVAGQPPLGKAGARRVTRRYRCTAATMHATDTDIGKLQRELAKTGQLGRTIVVYLSDNGYYFGEHRLTRGKVWPYEPALQVPFAVRVPPAYRAHFAPRRSSAVVSNTDIAPTLLDFAGGVSPCARHHNCRVLDGRSMRPLLGGRGAFPARRGVLAEVDTNFDGGHLAYRAIRTPRRLYVDYGGAQRELYNLDTDPFELDNLAGRPGVLTEQLNLAQRLAALADCHGTSGPKACE